VTDTRDYQAEKKAVARNFNASADSYDEVAVLQQVVADRLLERLALIKVKARTVLDLGSGTGFGAKRLGRKYRKARVIQADIAEQMLRSSRRNFRRLMSRQSYVCTDAEQLPFREAVCDLVFSNMMLQWSNNLDQVYAEVGRVMKEGGLFIFSSLGPDTLKELRESWSRVDDKIHVNAFIDMHDCGDALLRAGFENPVMETEYFTLTYEDVFSMMRELKQLGAQNVNLGRRHSLTGKGRIRNLVDAYEQHRFEGRLPLTYEVVYGHAWCRGQSPVNREKEDTVKIPVTSIKRRPQKQGGDAA